MKNDMGEAKHTDMEPLWKQTLSEREKNLLRLDRELVARAKEVALPGTEAEVVQRLLGQIEARLNEQPPPKKSILDTLIGVVRNQLGLPFSIGDDGLPILRNGERPLWVKPVWEFLTR